MGDGNGLDLARWAGLDAQAAMARLGSSPEGLNSAEAARRLQQYGPNAVRSHGARPLQVLVRQVKSPLLLLLIGASIVSLAVGQQADAAIIFSIIALSVGLGFVNEYRSERAVEALHERIRHTAAVKRDGNPRTVDVTQLVPGDVVRLTVGDVVPADLRMVEISGLEIDEALLTGEPVPAPKSVQPAPAGTPALEAASCAFMGTVVRQGSGWGLVVATGPRTEFGRIAVRLGERPAQTAFELGLRSFATLLVRVTLALTVSIFVINAILGRSLLESGLFALAIAVGLTPQLLPAIVTISLSSGARRLAAQGVVVKRLVSIEDLGNIEVLFTDKTGTLTEGRVTFEAALDPAGKESKEVLKLGLLSCEAMAGAEAAVGGSPLDRALVEAGSGRVSVEGYHRVAEAPFDYERRVGSVLVEDPTGRKLLVSKGAPESLLARCADVPAGAASLLDSLFAKGSRAVAVATREDAESIDERDLRFAGVLVFTDPPKKDAAESMRRLAGLGIEVKIVTGDNPRVAQKVCQDLGMPVAGTLTGPDLDRMSDAQLVQTVPRTTIFARVSPEQKSRIIRAQRSLHLDVGFMGDGVNDAVALHDADVGISVESATDVAKDAADIVLVTKDLGILAGGVMEGRRIFANTIKYVLMGTSSNFGNMFSAAGASLVLKFLPMLPTQILVNNFLYDVSEMTIPTDEVDTELLERPAGWDTHFIRRFMSVFGPISSIYDFLTFGILIWVFHADEKLFHTAWFVESLATQSLVVFVIRTRRVPFFRSRPSRPLLLSTLGVVAVAVALPFTPVARPLGFVGLPVSFLLILVAMVATYLALVQVGVARFFRPVAGAPPLARRPSARRRRIHRLATRWSQPLPVLPAEASGGTSSVEGAQPGQGREEHHAHEQHERHDVGHRAP